MESCSPLICKTPSGASPPAPSVHLCPTCGQRTKKVKRLTMEHLLLPGAIPQIGNTQYYFCETPTCSVVYFPYDTSAAEFHKADLRVRVGVKETEEPVPLCYCFGITRKEVWDEIENTGKTTVAGRIKAEVQAGNCACEVKNPSGKCCLGNVTRAVQEGMKMIRSLSEGANC